MSLAVATGWPEAECLWMPLSRALVYIHARNVAEGARTRWVFADAQAEAATRRKLRELVGPAGENFQ